MADEGLSPAVAAWKDRGSYRQLAGHRLFLVDVPAHEERVEPLLVIHGFPTCSFDFHHIIDELALHRRMLLLDMPGFGLSEKPDTAYSVDLLADAVAALTKELHLDELALVTHDLGDTVGGELLARQGEGRWPVRVTNRVVTNGSVYIDMAQLSSGQQLLLSLPDEQLPAGNPITQDSLATSLRATFAAQSDIDEADLRASAELISYNGGHRLLPRLIRYIEERKRNERRFTGAIESHPSPLTIVWGDEDPIAVFAMTDKLVRARPDASLVRLEGVGHYPMLEDPIRFAAALLGALG